MITVVNRTITVFQPDASKAAKFEFRGLSGDTKPTKIGAFKVANGSEFVEIDTGKVYMFNETAGTWGEF